MQALQATTGVAERRLGRVGTSPASGAVDLDRALLGDPDQHVPERRGRRDQRDPLHPDRFGRLTPRHRRPP